jgi:hypothetical protein
VSDDLDDVRAKLRARRETCLQRLDDAVSELVALHTVDAEEVLASVRATIEREVREAGQSAPT